MTLDEYGRSGRGVFSRFLGAAADMAKGAWWLAGKGVQYSPLGVSVHFVAGYTLDYDWRTAYLQDYEAVESGLRSALETANRVRGVLEKIGGHGGTFLAALLMNDQEALDKFSVQQQLIAEVLGDSLLDLVEALSESIADPEQRGELAGAILFGKRQPATYPTPTWSGWIACGNRLDAAHTLAPEMTTTARGPGCWSSRRCLFTE